MKYLIRWIKTPALPTLFYFNFHQPLDAYLDPGTGSIILQVVIGIAAGGLLAVTLFWHRSRTFLKNLFSRGQKHDTDKD